MFRFSKCKQIIKSNFKAFSVNKTKNCSCNNNTSEEYIKSEDEIREIICEKIKEYQELIMTRSPESDAICADVTKFEPKLRKKYGFSKDEDLTVYPDFEFNDPEIENQIDWTDEKS